MEEDASTPSWLLMSIWLRGSELCNSDGGHRVRSSCENLFNRNSSEVHSNVTQTRQRGGGIGEEGRARR